ncbi:hypothetical protein HDE_14147 [Halotydeus destructor]|nr:hypothetical protein HDE_14147 [Halotydeus destructor]
MSHKAIRSTPKTSRDSVQSPSLLQMCVKCGVAFNSKDKHKHTDKYCSSIIENGFVNGEGDQSSSSNHGFIKDGVLLAKLEDGEVREKDLDKRTAKLSKLFTSSPL